MGCGPCNLWRGRIADAREAGLNADPGHETGRDAVLTHGVLSEHPEDLLHGTGGAQHGRCCEKRP